MFVRNRKASIFAGPLDGKATFIDYYFLVVASNRDKK